MFEKKVLDKGKVLDWLDKLIDKDIDRLSAKDYLTTISIIKKTIKQGAFDIRVVTAL